MSWPLISPLCPVAHAPGFLFGALSEIFGGGSILSQLSAHPQSVLVTLGLITAATIIPIVKGTNGNYLRSL